MTSTHLVAHLHFFPTLQAKQKNTKEPPSQRAKTAVNYENYSNDRQKASL